VAAQEEPAGTPLFRFFPGLRHQKRRCEGCHGQPPDRLHGHAVSSPRRHRLAEAFVAIIRFTGGRQITDIIPAGFPPASRQQAGISLIPILYTISMSPRHDEYAGWSRRITPSSQDRCPRHCRQPSYRKHDRRRDDTAWQILQIASAYAQQVSV